MIFNRKIIKNNITNFFDKYFYNISFISYLLGLLYKNNCSIINKPFSKYSINGKISDQLCFIFSTSQGLFLYKNKSFFHLLSNSSYGITHDSKYIYAFIKTKIIGHIARFKIVNDKIQNYEIVIWGLSRGIHQIDIINNVLCLTDTYNNRIIKVKNYKKITNQYWKFYSETTYPNGKLKNGRISENYNHFNSIFKFKNRIYLIAHNETYKTSRKSELFIMDENFSLVNKIKLNGSNSHNFYKNEELEIFCASLEGEIVLNGKSIVENINFPRGLSLYKDCYLIGSSPIQFDVNNRNIGIAKIYLIDKNYNKRLEFSFKNFQINEIRTLNNI